MSERVEVVAVVAAVVLLGRGDGGTVPDSARGHGKAPNNSRGAVIARGWSGFMVSEVLKLLF